MACVPNSTLADAPLFYGFEHNHDYPPFKHIVDFEQALAGFLLVREKHAWLGYSWMSCVGDFGRGGAGDEPGMNITFPAAMSSDYGEPVGHCTEVTAGGSSGSRAAVFRREWSKSTVELDCMGWTAKIDMKTEPVQP